MEGTHCKLCTRFTDRLSGNCTNCFTNFNRIHVVPPCNVTDTEAKEGLAILDEVFALLGKYYTGE